MILILQSLNLALLHIKFFLFEHLSMLNRLYFLSKLGTLSLHTLLYFFKVKLSSFEGHMVLFL